MSALSETPSGGVELELDDIQSGVLHPRPTPYVGRFLLVRIDSPEAGSATNWDRLPPGFRGLGSRPVVEEARCSPDLKELSRQVWLNSIGPAVEQFLGRY